MIASKGNEYNNNNNTSSIKGFDTTLVPPSSENNNLFIWRICGEPNHIEFRYVAAVASKDHISD